MASNQPPPPGGTPPPPPGGPPPPPPSGGGPPDGYPPTGYVPYGQQGPVPPSRTSGLAVASLVLGIIGILLCFFFIPWILAIIFGAVAIKQCNDDPTLGGRGLAVAGLSMGIVAGVLVVGLFAFGDVNFDFNNN